MAITPASTPPDSAPPAGPLTLTLSSTFISRLLLALSALVSIAGGTVELLKPQLKLKDTRGALPFFSLSYEQNLPTFYTCALLLFCAFLLTLIARAQPQKNAPYRLHWHGLALGFFYIAADELISIHESLGFLKLSGLLYFSWVIPASLIVAFLGIAYFRFLLHLPRRTTRIFLIAGAIYILGAVGMELPLGYWTERHGSNNLTYGIIDWIEETLELIGLSLFAPALIEHLANLHISLGFSNNAPNTSKPSETSGS